MLRKLCLVILVLGLCVKAQAQNVHGNPITATWTTATTGGASGATVKLDASTGPWQGVFVYITGGANLTAGAVTFENGTSSSSVITTQLYRTNNSAANTTYTLVSSTSQAWVGSLNAPYFQVRLSTAITASAGVGTTTVTIVPYAFSSGSGGGSAVTSVDGGIVALGSTTDTACTATDTTSEGLVCLIKELVALGKTVGQTTMAASVPVVLASDQSSIPITNAGTFAVQAQPTPVTSGGLTPYVLEPAASDNHAVIKNGAGQVYNITVFNNSGTINYMRLYNAGTGFNGCNSATNLAWEGHIPADTADAGVVVDISQGIAFSTGISICVTGAYGQTNTTNATAGVISVNVGYK